MRMRGAVRVPTTNKVPRQEFGEMRGGGGCGVGHAAGRSASCAIELHAAAAYA